MLALWTGVVLNVHAATFYVNVSNSAPASPFNSWATAATNIQDAVDAATNGDLILVTNGIYQTGGRAVYGTETNRVALTNSITLLSVNGPAAVTIIGGTQTRCVYVGTNAVLSGFTLTNGNASTNGDLILEQSGGGVWCASSATVSNCVISGNKAQNNYAGGAYGGSLVNCLLTNNSASYGGGACSNQVFNCTLIKNSAAPQAGAGGGAIYATLSNCLLVANNGGSAGAGGGAAFSMLMGCVVSNNSAFLGGGVYGGTAVDSLILTNIGVRGGGAYTNFLNNCVLANNRALDMGGGAGACVLVNCTVVSNTVTGTPPLSPGDGGGISGGSATNCIIYYNSAYFNPPNFYYLSGNISYCCTTPDPGLGTGNITNDPAFMNPAGGNFHLSANSPCINSGKNSIASGTNDLDGNPRIVGGTVDIGAYEYQTPVSTISYAWLQQYGLPIIAGIDTTDYDGTGMNNWQKWIAGLNPTNPASRLVLTSAASTNKASGIKVSWQSVSNRTYYLLRGSNLTAQPPFTSIQSNIVGQAGTSSYQDTTATNSGPYFYRVGVQ